MGELKDILIATILTYSFIVVGLTGGLLGKVAYENISNHYLGAFAGITLTFTILVAGFILSKATVENACKKKRVVLAVLLTFLIPETYYVSGLLNAGMLVLYGIYLIALPIYVFGWR